MILQEYLENPCGLLSIPFGKAQKTNIPEHMKIIHNNDFSEDILCEYNDTEYFRIKHNLKKVDKSVLPSEFCITTITESQTSQLVELINNSYTHLGIKVDIEQVKGWTSTEVYAPDLWTSVYKGSIMIGAIVVDYDNVAKEAIIEWMQVLPEYRGMGIASAILNDSLQRMQGRADFVTVSGMVNNITKPEMIYRKCGFIGDDIWHILSRKII
ncbi:GNAT family N-acetyltransferase [Anaerocolumna sp. AGMB13020]|uniref:GNAT family N-acetyltransferase n=1 Tax=Anaerocolumna sp. AGMB13020 TaxID=3081750 RepID=UPI0029547524|nr:GNAT family N-acetyltransferase [Anaerocolumna sp. AGMB13020]WOO35272.1 GNAT family N-acetyltransferase [Anaerocolumna sp. AGMB13020]